jgi:hypothetical protein
MVGLCYYFKVDQLWSHHAGQILTDGQYLIGTATQYSACAVLINYWIPATKVNNGVWITIFIIITSCVQFMPVQFFGEFEVSSVQESALRIRLIPSCSFGVRPSRS